MEILAANVAAACLVRTRASVGLMLTIAAARMEQVTLTTAAETATSAILDCHFLNRCRNNLINTSVSNFQCKFVIKQDNPQPVGTRERLVSVFDLVE